MVTYLDFVIAFVVVKNWVSLELSTTWIILLHLLLIKISYSFIETLSQVWQLFFLSKRQKTTVVNILMGTFLKFLYLFFQHDAPVVFYKFFKSHWKSGIIVFNYFDFLLSAFSAEEHVLRGRG